MPFLVWLAWFGVYLRTLSPGLGGEDSGEFATVAVSLGIAHPPGYPFLTLLGRLVSLVPLGSPAFRLNLLSAACAAGALAILYSLVRREARARWRLDARPSMLMALGATCVLGFSQALWHEAVISDKYPLNLLLFSAVAWSALAGSRWELTAFLLGLGFSHHLQTLYLVPGLAFLAWRRRPISFRRLALCSALFLAGFSPKALFPPIRAVQDPALVLGQTSTAGQWFSYVRASQYTERVGGDGAGARMAETAGVLGGQTMWFGALAGAGGLALWSAGAGPAGGMIWLTAAAGIWLTSVLGITGREFYLLPVSWILAFGFGCLLAWAWAGTGLRRRVSVFAVFPLVVLAVNFPWGGSGRVSLEYDYGKDILAGLPGRAVLFTGGDDVIYPVMYLQGVEGYRTDVTAIPEGFLTFSPSREKIKRGEPAIRPALEGERWLRTEDEWGNAVARAAIAGSRRVFLTTPFREGLASGLLMENRDLVFELLPPSRRNPAAGTPWMRARGWYHDPRGLTARQRHVVALYALYQRQYGDVLSNTGQYAASLPRFRRALSNGFLADREGASNNFALALEKAGQADEALEVYARLVSGGTEKPEIFLNAGNLFMKAGDRGKAADMFRKALALAPVGSAYSGYARARLRGIERRP